MSYVHNGGGKICIACPHPKMWGARAHSTTTSAACAWPTNVLRTAETTCISMLKMFWAVFQIAAVMTRNVLLQGSIDIDNDLENGVVRWRVGENNDRWPRSVASRTLDQHWITQITDSRSLRSSHEISNGSLHWTRHLDANRPLTFEHR